MIYVWHDGGFWLGVTAGRLMWVESVEAATGFPNLETALAAAATLTPDNVTCFERLT